MRNIVSISLPADMVKEIKQESKKERATISEFVRKAVHEFCVRRKLDRLRQKTMLELTKKGISVTEQQLFEKIS